MTSSKQPVTCLIAALLLTGVIFAPFEFVESTHNTGSFSCEPVPGDEISVANNLNQTESLALLKEKNEEIIQKLQEIDDNSVSAEALSSKIVELQILAEDRKRLFVEMLRHSPQDALSVVLEEDVRAKLDAMAPKCVETAVMLEGNIEIFHVDLISGSSYNEYFLVTEDSKRLNVYPVAELGLLSSTEVRIGGLKIDDNILFDGRGSPNSPQGGIEILSEPVSQVLGQQRAVVLLVNFNNTQQPPLNSSQLNNTVFNQINGFYVENSYGKISLTGDVFDPFQLQVSASCDIFAVHDTAVAAADTNVFFPNYGYVIIVAPTDCPFAGVGTVGPFTFDTQDGTVLMATSLIDSDYGDGLRVIGHELGHNFGSLHASSLDCPNLPISPRYAESYSDCQFFEYGDEFDIMGLGPGHFNAPHKELMGWFNQSNLLTVSASGQYTLEPYETSSAGLKALKIQRTASDYLYLEYRQPIGFDSTLHPASFNGTLIHILGTNGTSQPSLIYAVSGSDSVFDRAPLIPGKNFTDPATLTVVNVLSANATGLTVDVNLGQLDNTSPTASITSPSLGSVLSGIVSVTATANDNVGIGRVEFLVNSVIRATVFDAPYTFSWHTFDSADGPYTLQAAAFDPSGNNGTSPSIPVTIHNGPLIKGDTNFDTHVNVLDIIKIARHIVGSITLSIGQIEAADVSPEAISEPCGDGMADLSDITAIASAIVTNDAEGFLADRCTIKGNVINMTQPTSGGSLDVELTLSPAPLVVNQTTTLNIRFLHKDTSMVHEHIDYRVLIKKNETVVFSTILDHTHPGTASLQLLFASNGDHVIEVIVEGIDFIPITPETASFPVSVS